MLFKIVDVGHSFFVSMIRHDTKDNLWETSSIFQRLAQKAKEGRERNWIVGENQNKNKRKKIPHLSDAAAGEKRDGRKSIDSPAFWEDVEL